MWRPRFLSSNYPMEKHFFCVPKFTLTMTGIYPELEQTPSVYIRKICNACLLISITIMGMQFAHSALQSGIVMILETCAQHFVVFLSFTKFLCVWWFRDELKAVIQRVRELTEAQNSPKKNQFKLETYPLCTQFSSLVLFVSIGASIGYFAVLLVPNTIRVINGLDWIRETSITMKLPTLLQKLPLYPIMVCLVQYGSIMILFNHMGIDGSFLSFCLYLSVLLKSIGEDIMDLLEENTETDEQESEDIICERLGEIIDRHSEISDLVERLSQSMAALTLAQFVTSGLIIGMTLVNILLAPRSAVFTYVCFTCTICLQIFFYCFGGTRLMQACVDLEHMVYASQWYNHSIRVQKMVLVMLVKAQQPLEIKIPFFSPTMETFAAILKFASSILTLMLEFN